MFDLLAQPPLTECIPFCDDKNILFVNRIRTGLNGLDIILPVEDIRAHTNDAP